MLTKCFNAHGDDGDDGDDDDDDEDENKHTSSISVFHNTFRSLCLTLT